MANRFTHKNISNNPIYFLFKAIEFESQRFEVDLSNRFGFDDESNHGREEVHLEMLSGGVSIKSPINGDQPAQVRLTSALRQLNLIRSR